MEQVAFLIEAFCGVGDWNGWVNPVVHKVNEIFLAKDGAGFAETRPTRFLHPSDNDALVFPAGSTVSSQQGNRIRCHNAAISDTGRELLFGDEGNKRCNACCWPALREVARSIKQRHDRVKVSIGLGAGCPATQCDCQQAIRQPGGRPDRPQYFLDTAAFGLHVASLV